MAGKPVDISAKTSTAGSLTYYSFDVVDEKNGHIIDHFETTDPAEAEKYLELQKEEWAGNATFNKGGPIEDADPFTDGSFESQADDVGTYAKGRDLDDIPSEHDLDGDGRIDEPGGGVSDLPPEARATSGANSKGSAVSSRIRKLARDYCGLRESEKKTLEALSEDEINNSEFSGLFGGIRKQAQAKRYEVPSEKIMKGKDNSAFIVIGNDRAGNPETGYGGYGHTQCDAIDIVAGLGGFCPREVEKYEVEGSIEGETEEFPIALNPNFFVDAARIYISQKTDADLNFGIGKFGKSRDPERRDNTAYATSGIEEREIGPYGAKSAVVAKADNIRLIGRESIRIVTGTDERNSQGGKVLGKHGIDLIAMNDVKALQPIVLGNYLELALITIVDNLEALCKIFEGYVHYQTAFNKEVAQHTHRTAFFGKKSLPAGRALKAGIKCDVQTMVNTELSVMKHITNLQGIKNNFLTDSGHAYINSRNNKVN
jgi:hypothetical protein